MLLKVMIVDDEKLFRDYLINLINWQEYGLELAIIAKNADEAMEQLKKVPINIALLDISMPKINGIDFAKMLLEIDPNIKIVFITGHDKFEYAKSAIKLGICDYILKPFDEQELMSVLAKIIDRVHKEIESIEEEEKGRDLVKSIVLNDLVLNSKVEDPEALTVKLRYINISFVKKYFQVVVMDSGYAVDGHELDKKRLVEDWNKNMDSQINNVSFIGLDGRVVSILNTDGALPFESISFNNFIDSYNGKIKIAVGKCGEGLSFICESHSQALIALKTDRLNMQTKVVFYEDLNFEEINIGKLFNKYNERITKSLRMESMELLEACLKELRQEINLRIIPLNYTHLIYLEIIKASYCYLESIGEKPVSVLGDRIFRLDDHKSLNELNAYVEEIFERILLVGKKRKQSKGSKLAQAVKEYINTYYMEYDLTVDSVAKKLFVHVSYLRATFKKEMYTSVSNYILQVRMEKALMIVKRGNVKINEIANQVGYTDAGYFSRVFKQYYGCSPIHYDDMH